MEAELNARGEQKPSVYEINLKCTKRGPFGITQKQVLHKMFKLMRGETMLEFYSLKCCKISLMGEFQVKTYL